jgi:guanylate kinase
MGLPALTQQERVAALNKAAAARAARAAAKEQLKAGTLSISELLTTATQDGAIARMRVTELLESLPGVGAVTARNLLQQLGIAASRRVKGLGTRQREALVDFMNEKQIHPHTASKEYVSKNPGLTVLAGPTAVGKGTVSTYIRDNYPNVWLSVSATTRPPRPGEQDGVHYFFKSPEEFDALIEAGELLEWAVVHGQNRYGTLRSTVEEAIADGRSVLLEIDLQGARQVKQAVPDAKFVFLAPPSWEEMVRRLVGRGTETADEQQQRLETAKLELAAEPEFDHTVINDDVRRAADELVSLMGLIPNPR